MRKYLLLGFSTVTIVGGADILLAQKSAVLGCPAVPPGCRRIGDCICSPNPTGGTICSDQIECGPIIETRSATL